MGCRDGGPEPREYKRRSPADTPEGMYIILRSGKIDMTTPDLEHAEFCAERFGGTLLGPVGVIGIWE